MAHTLQVIVEHDKDGHFAFVPERKGCRIQVGPLDEVKKAMRAAIDRYMRTPHRAETEGMAKKRVYTTSMPVNLG